ncbi:MAG: hypothetical protein KF878_08960 [Planctomycetes bacterium]|nr:hypothetical protein [Planctomycetota bacterium]
MQVDREQVARAFEAGDPDLLSGALISVAFHDPDWRWAQDRCLEALEHPSPVVRGLAATCLGHVARIHRRLDLALVRPRLEALRQDAHAGSRAADALKDIERLLGG